MYVFWADSIQFDPTRAQNHGPIDLADNGAPVVEPYRAPAVASTGASPEMAQYPRSAATPSDGGYGQGVSRGPSTATSAGFAGRGAGPAGLESAAVSPSPPPMPSGGALGAAVGAGGAAGMGGAAGAMNAKQREAYQEQQRFRVRDPYGQGQHGPAAGSSGIAPPMSPTATSASGGVTVHQDGGVAEDDPNMGSEIPPT